jgi:hypothetical protein
MVLLGGVVTRGEVDGVCLSMRQVKTEKVSSSVARKYGMLREVRKAWSVGMNSTHPNTCLSVAGVAAGHGGTFATAYETPSLTIDMSSDEGVASFDGGTTQLTYC